VFQVPLISGVFNCGMPIDTERFGDCVRGLAFRSVPGNLLALF